MKICHACKREAATTAPAGRRDRCSSCDADLHCCLNCKFYDRSAAKQCKEPVAESVKEKTKSNFCDYFVFKESQASGTNGLSEARRALDDLFRK